MYKVELLQSDILQQQSIDRRRRLDDERKRRIFDPKIRVMGVFLNVLNCIILCVRLTLNLLKNKFF